MDIKPICENRKNGIYYTPVNLADYLVTPLISSIDKTIFDPAYGNGALLLSAEKVLKEKINSENSVLPIFGCDKQPVNGKLSHFHPNHLTKMDFFDYPLDKQFDIILMNPPYIRHHLLDNTDRKKYLEFLAPYFNLHLKSDLWAFFLVKSILHLREMGSIGAILPWSFLQAEYAERVRCWLLDKFEKIKSIAMGAEYFPNAQERVILLWLENFKKKTKSITITFPKKLEDIHADIKVSKKSWQSTPVVSSNRFNFESIINRFVEDYGFVRFRQIATVRIGVVTGADRFFILEDEEADRRKFKREQLIPILSSAKDLSALNLNGRKDLKKLIVFSDSKMEHESEYLKEGEKQNFHLRTHSQLRKPWYNVNIGKIPDAFFPYRMAHTPFLMQNNHAQCTNSIHRIYFHGLSKIERKWVQLSLLAVPGQLSLECYSKTYGRGLLKIEPGALKNAIVYLSDDPIIDSVYEELSQLIASGEKFKATEIASSFLDKQLGVNSNHSKRANFALTELRNRRLTFKS